MMQGRVENSILDFAKQHDDQGVEVTVANPGGIESPGRDAINAPFTTMLETFGHTPTVHLSELAAAMIDQCLHGITEGPLWGEDLVEIYQRALSPEDYLRCDGQKIRLGRSCPDRYSICQKTMAKLDFVQRHPLRVLETREYGDSPA